MVLAVTWGTVGVSAAGSAATRHPSGPMPEFSAIRQSLIQYFQKRPGYHKGGILAQSDVEPLAGRLAALGWLPPDWASIAARVPADDSFLVQELRTPAGRKFAARIAPLPLGYDRVDRLSRLADGQKTVRTLVQGPDGYKLIEYMTTSRGGKNLGRQLAHVPRGEEFNKPTGQVYTLDHLLAELKTRYDAAKNPEKKNAD